MKFVLLRPEQLIFDSEEAAINHYRNPKPTTPEERWANQQINGMDDPLEKVLVCKVECVQVITPTIAVDPGGDQHFVDYAEAERKRRAESADLMRGAMAGAVLGSKARARFDS